MAGIYKENLNGQQQEGTPAEGQAAQGASTPEPTDLASAFKAYREQNAQMAGDGVPAGEPESGEGVGSEGAGSEQHAGESGSDESEGAGAGLGDAGDLAPAGGQGDLGGPAAPAADFDYSSYEKTLATEIDRAALQAAQRKFAELGINKITISQLYQRDERTGSVKFINPDDPNKPFTSRAEAQAWCVAFNQDYDAEFRKAAVAERDRLVKQYQPTKELVRFAPKFEKFDKVKQEVINDMIEPYAVKDQTGKVIGYNCNLDAVAARADKLIARFQTVAAQPAQVIEPAQQASQGTEPALDMKGSGSGSSGEKEPKDLAEALRIVQAKKKGKK